MGNVWKNASEFCKFAKIKAINNEQRETIPVADGVSGQHLDRKGVLERLVAERGLEGMVEVDSAGTYGGHSGQLPDPRMRRHAARRGYDLRHVARQVKAWDFDDFDLIVGMDAGNVRDLLRLAPTAEARRKVVMIMSLTRITREARALSWCWTCWRRLARICWTRCWPVR